MTAPTTNEAIRRRYENGNFLVDGPTGNAAIDSPANGANTVVASDSDVHIVTADGTNTADLSNAAEEGRKVTVVHNGGANIPEVAFADADFVGTGPANLTAAGDTATLLNIDGTASGWVVAGTGSA